MKMIMKIVVWSLCLFLLFSLMLGTVIPTLFPRRRGTFERQSTQNDTKSKGTTPERELTDNWLWLWPCLEITHTHVLVLVLSKSKCTATWVRGQNSIVPVPWINMLTSTPHICSASKKAHFNLSLRSTIILFCKLHNSDSPISFNRNYHILFF